MNTQFTIDLKKIGKMLVFITCTALCIFVAFQSIFYLAPFIIAFIISSLIEPLISLLVKKAKLPRKISAALALILVFSLFGLVLTIIVSNLVVEIANASHMLPKYFSDLYDNVNSLMNKANELYLKLPQEVTINMEGLASNLTTSLMNILNSFLKGILNTAISIPEAIVFTLVTILSTFFFASDRDKIFKFCKAQIPSVWSNRIYSIKTDIFSAFFGYIKAQLIMMTITFTELSVGFWMIGINDSILLAFAISIIDALPILGTGGILIPWSVYELVIGNVKLGLSLLIIYGIVLIVRQMLEPKVLSQQIGIHPLVTLIAMYTGLKLLGFVGLILGPVTVLLLKNIFKAKTLKGILCKVKVPADSGK